MNESLNVTSFDLAHKRLSPVCTHILTRAYSKHFKWAHSFDDRKLSNNE